MSPRMSALQVIERGEPASVIGAADLCHPVTSRTPFTREGWLFELKQDGFRALVRKAGTRVQLLSRQGRSLAAAFPEIVAALASANGDAVLDGELVVPDAEGRSDFEELRRRSLLQRPRSIQRAAEQRPALLVLFDILSLDGDDIRGRSLAERRSVLEWFGLPGESLQVAQSIETHGEALFREIVRHDQEGIVAKRLEAPYRAGRQATWVKIKNRDYSRRGAVEWQRHR